ncbi:TerD family protein, partial [Clostridioides difficile]|nr:TerD family protein [Clostridioides difficile]
IGTAIGVAEIYKHNGELKFNALGSCFEGCPGSLSGNL